MKNFAETNAKLSILTMRAYVMIPKPVKLKLECSKHRCQFQITIMNFVRGALRRNVLSVRWLSGQSSKWKVNMLYDSECPLCMHEIRFLEARNKAGLVKFTDISHPDYNPGENGSVSYEEGMKRIHAVMEDGQVISGVEVFRKVYETVGLGWVWAVTQIPGIAWLAEGGYRVWAGWRMKITGREELEEIFKKRTKLLEVMKDRDRDQCNDKECKM